MEEEQPREREEEVIDNRPLDERLGDSNWKARLAAYEFLKTSLPSDASMYPEFVAWLGKITADSNANALDAGLDVALLYAEYASADLWRPFADKMFANIVDKTFGARPSTQNKGKALLMKLMEADEAGPACSYLLTRLGDKKPKIPPLCLEILRAAVVAFGVKAVPAREILGSLSAVLNGSNGAAREAALQLVVEMFQWIGRAPFNSLFENIRSAQKTEIEKLLSEREAAGPSGPPLPQVYLRKERPSPEALAAREAALSGKGSSTSTAQSAQLDSREFIEEIDLTKRLRATEFATLIAEEKWSEQLRGLQLVVDILGPTPKVKSGCDVHDIVAACKGFLRQGHLQLQTMSLKIVALLADGMRSEFASAIRPVTQAIVLKCKEKRLIPDMFAACLNILKYCLGVDSFLEDFIGQLRDKKTPPHGKVCLMELIAASASEIPEKFSSDSLKPLIEAFVSNIEDSDPKVREASCAALAALSQIVKRKGKSATDANKLIQSLETSAPRVFKKIQAAQQQPPPPPAAGSSSTGVSVATTHAPAAAPASTRSDTTATATSGGVGVGASSVPKRAAVKTSASAGGASKKAAAVAATGTAVSADDDEVDDLTMPFEEAEQVLASLNIPDWETVVRPGLSSSKWQEKCDAIAAIGNAIVIAKNGGALSAPLVSYLSATNSGFKITNVNIMKTLIQVLTTVAENNGDTKFSRPAAWELIKHFGEKFSDKKTKEPLDALLMALSEATSPAFVLKRMKLVMDKSKSPVAHQCFLEWIKVAIHEFGATAFPVQFVGQLCQAEMEHKVSAVRTAAVEVMGALYHQIGPKLQAIAVAEDTKPQLKALLEAEFSKVGFDPAAAANAARAKSGKLGAADVAAGQVDLPRFDMNSLDKELLNEMNLTDGKTSWQNRKSAMETVIEACERSGFYVEGNKAAAEYVRALKSRLTDTQANLKPIAAKAVGSIICSVDVDSAVKLFRLVAATLAAGIADNKKQMRDAAIGAIQMSVTMNKDANSSATAEPNMMAVLTSPLCETLMNTVARQDLLFWLLPHVNMLSTPADSSSSHFGELVSPLVNCLQDKSASVRSLAEQTLLSLMRNAIVPKVLLDRATRDLPPATRRSIQASVDRMLSLYGTATTDSTPIEALASNDAEVLENAGVVDAVSAESAVSDLPVHTKQEVPEQLQQPQQQSATLQPAASKRSRIPSVTTTHASQVAAAISENLKPQETEMAVAEHDGRFLLKKTTKVKRVEDFFKTNWPSPPEEPGEAELNSLRVVWEPIMDPELAVNMFAIHKFGPPNQDAVLPVLGDLSNQLQILPVSIWTNHSDLLLRYLCYALCLRETSTGLLKVLSTISELMIKLAAEHYALHDAEINCILPHLIEKSGHKSERHKSSFKLAIEAVSDVVAPNKMVYFLLQGLNSKNKKSRVVCLEEIQRIVEKAGVAPLGRTGAKDIAINLDNKDNDPSGRSACLDLCYAIYVAAGSDLDKLKKMMGEMSERATSMLEERIKQKGKLTSGSTTRLPTAKPAHHGLNRGQHSHATDAEDKRIESVTGEEAAAPSQQTTEEFKEEAEDAPFQLEMTPAANRRLPKSSSFNFESPPGDQNSNLTSHAAIPATPSMDISIAYDQTLKKKRPAKFNSALSVTFPEEDDSKTPVKNPTTPSSSRKQPKLLSGIYQEISSKVLAYLDRNADEKRVAECAEDARDYIKILNAIVNKEWSQVVTEDDEQHLQDNIVSLLGLLLRCISYSFSNNGTEGHHLPATKSLPLAVHLDIDVSLLAVALATTYSIVRRADLLDEVLKQPHQLQCLLCTCLNAIVAAKLNKLTTEDNHAIDTAKQLVKALNTILLRLAADAPVDVALSALVDRLSQAANDDVINAIQIETLSMEGTKPAVTLMCRILDAESKKDASVLASPSKELLMSMHNFFWAKAKEELSSEDKSYDVLRALLEKLIAMAGAETVLSLLSAAGIGPDAFIVKLTYQLSGMQIPEPTPDLQNTLASLIHEIMTASDKIVPIKKLHSLRQQNPTLDLTQYLQSVSTAFRRFVLNTLDRLDARENSAEMSENFIPAITPDDKMNETSTPVKAVPTTFSGGEAMRIIENLKNKPPIRSTPLRSVVVPPPPPISTTPTASSKGGLSLSTPTAAAGSAVGTASGTTPRSLLNDRIWGSLNSLTASLELPPPNPSSGTTTVGPTGGDQDLASRLARLRAMQASRSQS